jgi:DNA-binding MarR family transcriptional regulator
MEPQKLKRVTIKEELVALTGNYVDAILLSQLLYWSERIKDFDLFIKQEAELEGREPEHCHFGWIYKSCDELSDETMLGLSASNMKRHLERLRDLGFIEIRQNRNKWDRRKEYKINLKYIQRELIKIGYSLDGYSLALPFSILENAISNSENPSANLENRTAQNRKTVTEITTETTTNTSTSQQKNCDEGDLKFTENSDEMKIVNFLIGKLKKNKPDMKLPDGNKKQKWALTVDRMLRLDKRDKHEICQVIEYVSADEFWSCNILSTDALRKHYDGLVMKMRKAVKRNEPKQEFDSCAETEAMLARREEERRLMQGDG